ncbi:MAG: efflux RND transporter periplasmic adaptor subunit, partial [Alphaproteobacteria bacterium]|nr:efflux RND transporter periplasmic adaptor subunit [Alphaproteobacteria bacterium]
CWTSRPRAKTSRRRAPGGGREAVDKAALALSTAEEELQELAESLDRSQIHAPLSGVVLAGSRGVGLSEGRRVGKGEVLATIGNFSRMAARAKVDEVDVVRIAVGQPASVTGNAFGGLRLRGVVTHVASQPDPQARGASRFDVVVTLDPLDGEQKKRIRAGMSSRLQIVVYSKEAALMGPLEAVKDRGRSYWVSVVDPSTREVSERQVAIGPTTQDSVEIAAGLQAGDEIVVRER